MGFTFTARHGASGITSTFRTIDATVAASTLVTLWSDETLFTRARTANRRAHPHRADGVAFTRDTWRSHARQYAVRPIIIRNAFVAIDACREILCANEKKMRLNRRGETKTIAMQFDF